MFRVHGRTLIEMLAVLSILGILTQNVSAAWQQSLAHLRARATATALLDAMRLARSSSVSLRHPVTICPDNGTHSCSDTWGSTLLVFTDHNGDGVRDAGESLLSQVNAPARRGKIEWRSFRKKKWLQFTPLGHTAQQNGSFVYCPHNNDARHAAVVIVNKLGHSRIARDRDGDGVVEMASGKPVHC